MAEYPFAKYPGQRWRFDFAWPALMLAVHVDGGAWVPGGGRHTRDAAFAADHDKMNRATLPGWRVLRFTSRHRAVVSHDTVYRCWGERDEGLARDGAGY